MIGILLSIYLIIMNMIVFPMLIIIKLAPVVGDSIGILKNKDHSDVYLTRRIPYDV